MLFRSIDVQTVFENFLKSKGRLRDGRGYQRLIQKEFKVSNFEESLLGHTLLSFQTGFKYQMVFTTADSDNCSCNWLIKRFIVLRKLWSHDFDREA